MTKLFAGVLLLIAACATEANELDTTVSAAECAAAQDWIAWTPYATGAVVRFEGTAYVCVQGHTSQPDWTPSAVPALWAPATCSADPGNPGTDPDPTDPGDPGGDPGTGDPGTAPAGLIFGPYKDTSINLDWNTNVASTTLSGARSDLASDLAANGGKVVTLAFATGECGNESWGGVPGAAMATANVAKLEAKGVSYLLATGGAAGSFTCGSDAGFTTFVNRWASPHLIGVDFDIEAGQSQAVIEELAKRIKAGHAAFPGLRFSLTIATLAQTTGGDPLNVYGAWTLASVKSQLGWTGSEATWPSYVTVNLMTMDYGGPSPGVCVVEGGLCNMGKSAVQAARSLHDVWHLPYSNIELTPMIGGNDVQNEHFTLGDVDTVATFAKANSLAGVHYWSYDRDTDCPVGSASPICNSLGGVGAHGFLARFRANGL